MSPHFPASVSSSGQRNSRVGGVEELNILIDGKDLHGAQCNRGTRPTNDAACIRSHGQVRHILICKGEGGAWQDPADMPAPSPSSALPAPQGAEPRVLLPRVDTMQGRRTSCPGECQAHWHYYPRRNAGTIPPDHRPLHSAALFPLPRPSAPPWAPFLPLPHLLSTLLTRWDPPTKSETCQKATLQSRQPHWGQGVGEATSRSSSTSSYAQWTARVHLLSLSLGSKWSIHTRACQSGSWMGFELSELELCMLRGRNV